MCIQYQKKHVACMHPNNFEGSYSRYDSSKMLPTKGAPSAHDWRLRRLIKINFISTTTGGLPIIIIFINHFQFALHQDRSRAGTSNIHFIQSLTNVD